MRGDRERALAARRGADELTSPKGGRTRVPLDLRPPWERVRAAAALAAPSPTLNSLRHTAASWWLSADAACRSRPMGHTNPQLVLTTYGHALPSERSTAGERREAFLAEVRG